MILFDKIQYPVGVKSAGAGHTEQFCSSGGQNAPKLPKVVDEDRGFGVRVISTRTS